MESRLIETDADAGLAPLELLVLLPVHDHRLVFAAERVREVVAVSEVTPLPAGTDALLGAVAVRGALLPLYDTREWCAVDDVENAPLEQRFATILDLSDASFAIQTTEHPTIVMSELHVEHRRPILIDDQVCIGVDPNALLQDLTQPEVAPIEGTTR